MEFWKLSASGYKPRIF